MSSAPRVITSRYAPPGTIYVIDPSAFDFLPQPEIAPTPIRTFDTSLYRAGMGIDIVGRGTMEERDPGQYPPRSLRAFWRMAKAIFGYEFRKASGSLRRVPRARHAIITNIAA